MPESAPSPGVVVNTVNFAVQSIGSGLINTAVNSAGAAVVDAAASATKLSWIIVSGAISTVAWWALIKTGSATIYAGGALVSGASHLLFPPSNTEEPAPAIEDKRPEGPTA